MVLSRASGLPLERRSGAEKVWEFRGETAPDRTVAAPVRLEERTSPADLTEPLARGVVGVAGCLVIAFARGLFTAPCVRIWRTDAATCWRCSSKDGCLGLAAWRTLDRLNVVRLASPGWALDALVRMLRRIEPCAWRSGTTGTSPRTAEALANSLRFKLRTLSRRPREKPPASTTVTPFVTRALR
jgi:hypothetical protein